MYKWAVRPGSYESLGPFHKMIFDHLAVISPAQIFTLPKSHYTRSISLLYHDNPLKRGVFYCLSVGCKAADRSVTVFKNICVYASNDDRGLMLYHLISLTNSPGLNGLPKYRITIAKVGRIEIERGTLTLFSTALTALGTPS
ncbi:hypothetical protein C362_05529 [Cryptococcus neoformans Bt1]|nr:hypothetical protein C362_05529 [Cryptococcus neoformans var. grubii Bt1]OXG17140.1 hypothetical protein C367_05180 [Cryptococcus neoformans var. grubii Ze90-1]